MPRLIHEVLGNNIAVYDVLHAICQSLHTPLTDIELVVVCSSLPHMGAVITAASKHRCATAYNRRETEAAGFRRIDLLGMSICSVVSALLVTAMSCMSTEVRLSLNLGTQISTHAAVIFCGNDEEYTATGIRHTSWTNLSLHFGIRRLEFGKYLSPFIELDYNMGSGSAGRQ